MADNITWKDRVRIIRTKLQHTGKQIGSWWRELYEKKRFKFWAIIAGITLILIALLILFVVHFGNQTEEYNTNQFLRETALCRALYAHISLFLA